MSIIKIVITGGPCAKKSTALRYIQATKAFTDMGYTVLCVPEAATELMTNGITPKSCNSLVDYQMRQLKFQLDNERIFEAKALEAKTDKILILCDRGTLDGKAYMPEKDFEDMLKKFNTDETELLKNYDAVFHLITTAKDAKEHYTLESNPARSETIEQAITLDDKILNVYKHHPHRYIINNSDFEHKTQKLIAKISEILMDK